MQVCQRRITIIGIDPFDGGTGSQAFENLAGIGNLAVRVAGHRARQHSQRGLGLCDGLLPVGNDGKSNDHHQRDGHGQDQEQEMGSYRRFAHRAITPYNGGPLGLILMDFGLLLNM